MGVPAAEVVLASDAPPVAGIAELEPELLGDTDRDLYQSHGSLLLLHRTMPTVAEQIGRHIRNHVLGADLFDLRLGLLERLERRGPQIHLKLTPLGHDVRPRPAVNDADVHRHARPSAVQRLQRDDHVGGLKNRVPALLRLDPRVSSPAVDHDPIVRDPFPR